MPCSIQGVTMIYIYDTVVDKTVTTFKRYGCTFKLERRSRMGDREYYSFVYPGMQKLLVIPGFAQQYKEIEAKVSRFPKNKDFEDYLKCITRQIDKYATYEEFPTDESETGTMHVISANYKDISVQFEFMNKKLTLSEEFDIERNNIFGNGITVLMNVNMEE